ncbi:MAG: SH3 domain-containing protein [Saprospiraceae bacterium]|nr:SH3 domain-containing protein [Saprospiraceae bacterium]
MGYRRKNRRNKKGPDTNKWILPLGFVLVLLWLIGSSIQGKSPTEFLSQVYYWVVGTESPSKSRTELKSMIDIRDLKIDSLSSELVELKNKSPYRTAIVNTTANSLNLRSEPNLASDVVIKIPDSSAVKILYFDEEILVLEGQTGKWCKIKYADKEGWVWGNYLEMVD